MKARALTIEQDVVHGACHDKREVLATTLNGLPSCKVNWNSLPRFRWFITIVRDVLLTAVPRLRDAIERLVGALQNSWLPLRWQ